MFCASQLRDLTQLSEDPQGRLVRIVQDVLMISDKRTRLVFLKSKVKGPLAFGMFKLKKQITVNCAITARLRSRPGYDRRRFPQHSIAWRQFHNSGSEFHAKVPEPSSIVRRERVKLIVTNNPQQLHPNVHEGSCTASTRLTIHSIAIRHSFLTFRSAHDYYEPSCLLAFLPTSLFLGSLPFFLRCESVQTHVDPTQ